MSAREKQLLDEEQRLAAQSQLAVAAMGQLIALEQALRLHDINNSMVGDLLADIVETARIFHQRVGEAMALALVQNSWFACRRLVRMSYTDYRKAEQLRALWNRLQVGEMIFPLELDLSGARAFAGLLQSGTTAAQRDGQSWGGVVVIAALSGNEGTGQLDLRPEFLAKAYCALVVLIGSLLEALRTGEPPPLLRIRRILQVLADGCQDHEALLCAMSARLSTRRGPHDLATHLASVALHALIIARHLRLPRPLLLGLATAAIFHDLPKLGLPEATLGALERPEGLSAEEQEQVRQRWRNALLGLLQAVGVSEELLPRLVVIHESQLEFSSSGAALYPERPDAELSLFSKVIAAANALEIFGRTREGAPQSPHLATSGVLHKYRQQVGEGVAVALLEALGWYPPGSAVVLEGGEVGIVVGVDMSRGERPKLRLVRGPGGELLDGPDLDLAFDSSRHVRWSLHPSRLGINPVPCFLPAKPAQ